MKKQYQHIVSRNLYWLLNAVLLQSCLVQRLDHTPYQQTDYYRSTLAEVQKQTTTAIEADTLQVGWAKVNITPPVGTPMAGYGKRLGMKYEQVHDSTWVRTFAFSNGSNKAYFVTLDMLIVPMSVTAALEKEYPKLGIKPEQVYLSATHTHTSFGGWAKKLAGRLMAGKYKKQVVAQTVQHIIQSIKQAEANLQPTRLSYGQASAAGFVRNRLTGSSTTLDSTLRFIKFEQLNGQTALLCTFSGHPTILPSMQPILSRDYPGELVKELERTVDFAAFSAGAVGSHQTVYQHGGSFESTEQVGKELAQLILKASASLPLAHTTHLQSVRVPLYLPEPQWRIGENKRFAPLLFNTFFGKYEAYLTSLQVGDIVFLGVPADYSGEFMENLQATASELQKQLVVTSFNGSYLGYVVPEEHYPLKKYEVRDMNFYGPQSGTYITEMLSKLLRLNLKQ
ncbi:neutral/alkaline non-lysosomal ceramidase N-terminal domain-containing protein [Pontibacter harenae]|uniref:neutral/alkaline non-lysosomal ceramidase N-terminal domain-containing protein n=1 Tax=Pontibacter harenae TaxID=2894083 RepID=UPI001E465233|nr:neutral/alkaline non-lysosomal ceramidase N-terminal domain-containing protein [Pontibacter harenae]MCC9166811.1 neutral/alkaline non-lysosomal ceramidase N-terminal domain-containing protein [Pontibacter harenae]